MRPALSPSDPLHTRTRSYRARVARSTEILATALAAARQPYVAFSGGKDSLVALHLAASLRPGITALWSDDELEYPGLPEYIAAVATSLRLPLVVTLGYAQHGGWFRPWTDRPYWRDLPPGALAIGEPVESWTVRQGYDLAILGLRAEEAMHRRLYLRGRGPLHQVRDGQWRCNPLAGWSLADLWAYIAEHELDYSPVYDRLAEIGVPRDRQRVGPLPLTSGWILRDGWPELYRGLVARYSPHHW